MMPRTHSFSLFFLEISLLGTSLFWLVVFWPGMSAAQITLDGSLGPAGALTGPDYVIDATLGRQRGGNLFHSFESFNVNTGESATFTGPRNVKNILSRVTGGQSSFIDGMLRSDIPDANLYLLNPSGVLFGENATLDVRGSFTVSTADTVYLGDRGQFNARQPEASLLTSAPPSAFGFLTVNPAGITLSGASLEVQDGQTISIIGGDIRLTGDAASAVGVNLDAPAGQVHLISVATSGEVGLDPASGDFSLTGFDRLGNITLTDGAVVDVSGEGSGTVFIRGGQLIVENATIAADTFGASDGGGIDIAVTDDLIVSKASSISADTLGAGDGGMITISANRVVLAGGELQQFADEGELLLFPQISTSSYEASGGEAGDIRISTSRLELRGGSVIAAETLGAGDGGAIEIQADQIILAGESSVENGQEVLFAPQIGTDAFEESSGRAGDIRITTGSLDMRNGALIDADTSGTGDGGSVLIQADILTMQTQATIGADAFGSGAGGTVTIQAGSIHMGDEALIDTVTFGPGQGGAITIETDQLTMRSGSVIDAGTSGTGQGGSITITADRILLDGNTSFETETGLEDESVVIPPRISTESQGEEGGQAGDILIHASQIELRQGATIAASSEGHSDAGQIVIQAGETFRSQQGFVTTEALQAGGGKITLIVGDTVQLIHSDITTTVQGGSGDAGNVTLDAEGSPQIPPKKRLKTRG